MDENAPITGGEPAAIAAAPAFPETPDGYEVRLPGEFQFPEGFQLAEGESPISADDRRLSAARDFAHANQMSQAQFESMVAMGVQADLAEDAAFREAIAEQAELLGPKAQERVAAVQRWVSAKLPEHQAQAILGTLFTRDQVEGFETLMRLNRGAVPGNPGAGRTLGPEELSEEEYSKMSVAQRITYAREHGRR